MVENMDSEHCEHKRIENGNDPLVRVCLDCGAVWEIAWNDSFWFQAEASRLPVM